MAADGDLRTRSSGLTRRRELAGGGVGALAGAALRAVDPELALMALGLDEVRATDPRDRHAPRRDSLRGDARRAHSLVARLLARLATDPRLPAVSPAAGDRAAVLRVSAASRGGAGARRRHATTRRARPRGDRARTHV